MSIKQFVQQYHRSLIIAGVMLLVILWLATGPGRGEIKAPAGKPDVMTVVVAESQAQPVNRRLSLQAELEPDRVVHLRARTAGRIEALPHNKGTVVEADTLIARIAMDDRESRLQRARAELKRAESEVAGARRLADQGHTSRLQLESAEAALMAARAALQAVQLDIDNTRIAAGMAGVLDKLYVEVGDSVTVGEPLADIVENNPLKAAVNVPQHQVHYLATGMPATVEVGGNRQLPGTLDYLAARADSDTRTLRAEIKVENPGRKLPAGLSAEVTIAVGEVMAHRLSPALISLDDNGDLVVKAVDAELRVQLYPVEIVRANADSVWVAGLPQQLRLITTGQGFVNAGDRVRIAADSPGSP